MELTPKSPSINLGTYENMHPDFSSQFRTIGLEWRYVQEGYTTCVVYNTVDPAQRESYRQLCADIEAQTGERARIKGTWVDRDDNDRVIASRVHVWVRPTWVPGGGNVTATQEQPNGGANEQLETRGALIEFYAENPAA